MKNKSFILPNLFLASLVMPVAAKTALNDEMQQTKRNIIVILCDQLRPDFLSAYGGKIVKCDGIDSLTNMGVVFDNATTCSPVSGPARASMITGRYPSSNGVWCNDHLPVEGMEYLPVRMNENGYITAAFGKLHNTPAADSRGFQIYIPMEESRLGEMEPYVKYMQGKYPNQEFNRFNDFSKNLQFSKPKQEHYDYWTTTNALRFLNDYSSNKFEKKPFFVWLSLQGPHGPYDPPKEMNGCADESKIPPIIKVPRKGLPSVIQVRRAPETPDKVLKKERIAYAEKIKLEDEQITRVLDMLKEKGLLENTTIIFSADHGDQIGDHNLGQKGPFPYPYHQNIPLILANCPSVKPGTRSDILVSNLDLASTCLDIAGDKKPLGLSRSLIKMLNDKSAQREFNFSEFADSYKMVEDKRYRMAFFPFDGSIMLFDKIKDPLYKHDLANKKEYAEIELNFMKRLMEFQIVCKGFHVESQDCTFEVQKGVEKINPNWKDDNFEIYFPMSFAKWKYLKDHNLEYKFNDFCIERKVGAAYGPFWESPKYK